MKYSQKIAYYGDITLIFSSLRECLLLTMHIYKRTSANPLVTQATSLLGRNVKSTTAQIFLPIHEKSSPKSKFSGAKSPNEKKKRLEMSTVAACANKAQSEVEASRRAPGKITGSLKRTANKGKRSWACVKVWGQRQPLMPHYSGVTRRTNVTIILYRRKER